MENKFKSLSKKESEINKFLEIFDKCYKYFKEV